MALDTRYRPQTYGDVLGQEATVAVLKQFVVEGRGFHQSYVFCGQHGSGKCVTGDTLVVTDKGVVPIVELMGPNKIDPLDVSVLQEGSVVAKAAYSYRDGIQPTYRITTGLGFQIEGTAKHRVRVMLPDGEVGWMSLGDIVEGVQVCLVPGSPLFGPGPDLTGFKPPLSDIPGTFSRASFTVPDALTEDWGRLMGYMVGDGSCTYESSVAISVADPDAHRDIASLLQGLCGSCSETRDARRESLYLLRCCRKTAREFLHFLGVGHHKAGAKCVPWSVFRSPKSVIRGFLRGYFEADGSASRSGVEVTTKSRRLAREVQQLLLMLGVVSRLGEKKHKTHGLYWRLNVLGAYYAKFQEEVGFVSGKKTASLRALVHQDHAQKKRLSNRWVRIPHQRKNIQALYAQVPPEQRSRHSDHLFRSRRAGQGGLTYGKAKDILAFLPPGKGASLQVIVDAGYHYDPVVSVVRSEAEVFDLNVPDGQMFAANGFMNHNTTLGRILARALLCEAPVDGAPCDQCPSCQTFLSGDTHECFEELDAATKSGKADLARIIEDVSYSTVSGKRRIYLFDECFTEDTVLLTRDGFRSIRDLVDGRFTGEVLSFNTETGQKVWRPVTDWFDLGDREVITLEFDNGVEITVTTNQEVYTTNRGWVEACRLTEDDDVEEVWFQRLVDGGRVARLIRKSEPFRAPVYDVTVEGTHSFFAASGPSPDHGILAHNCHRLSKNALDALLKPMEDSAPGSEDKRLVCIFCTTEPEKMVSTIFSRCAPAFVIRSAPLDAIASRLSYICGQEKIDHDRDALMLIAEQSGSHIRDAIKMVEGVSMLGGVTRDNASKYLHLDANEGVLDLLEALGSDLPKAVESATRLASTMSPSGAYERLAEASMLIYQVHLGVAAIPMKWGKDRVTDLASRGEVWLGVVNRFAAPPHRPTRHTLLLDTASAHHLYGLQTPMGAGVPLVVSSSAPPTSSSSAKQDHSPPSLSSAGTVAHGPVIPKAEVTSGGVYVDPRAVGSGPPDRRPSVSDAGQPVAESGSISPSMFRDLVRHFRLEIGGGRTRRDDMVGP